MSKPSVTRIVGAVLDDKKLLLYREDGTTVGILQGDPRLQPILDSVVPQINEQGWAELKDDYTDSFTTFEKKTGIKLFRVLKDAVKHLFSTDEERNAVATDKNLSVGKVPTAQEAAIASIQNQQAPEPKKKKAIPKLGEGLLSSARSVTEDSTPIQQDETVVAMVGNNLVPGMEMLKGQFDHIQKNNSEKGLTVLLERLGKMIDQRGHSVEDILRFLQRGDLPIADDGSIIAYKVLKTHSASSDHPARAGLFFDCHTGKVPQQVGSYVVVDESLVDKNRRNECSNGLHIARRGYINGFSGDILVLCKIAPEDVITVPHGDPNKVRVCGYHIIAQISEKDHATLRANRPMTDNDDAQILLAKAIAGDHIGKTEEVRITGQYGTGIVIKDLMKKQPAPEAVNEIKKKPKAGVAKAKAISLENDTAPAVDPKKLATAQAELKTKDTVKPLSRPEQAQIMFNQMMDKSGSLAMRQKLAQDLLELKKRAKSSWDNLGFEGVDVPYLIDSTMQEIERAPEKKAPKAAPKAAVKPVPKNGPSKAAQANDLFDLMNNLDYSAQKRKTAAENLLQLKKNSKQSWEALGLKGDVSAMAKEVIVDMDKALEAAKPIEAPPAFKAQEIKAKAPAKAKSAVNPLQAEEDRLDLIQRRALKMVREGQSKAEAERVTGISARSIGRLLDKFGK